MNGLAGQIALVTGGAVGIGRAIALKLAREGCDVAVLDRDEAAADATADAVRDIGRRAAAAKGDVADASSVREAIAALRAALGPVDILVNNAGIARLGPLLGMAEQDWHETFEVNVDGTFNVIRAVVPDMVERRRGVVVNMASWLGRRAQVNFGAYAASKFAIVGLTQALALEVAPHVRVNAIAPGFIGGTPMRAAIDEASIRSGLPRGEDRAKAVPLGRAGRPEDVANLAAFLASEEAAYITGAIYDVTGGMWMT